MTETNDEQIRTAIEEVKVEGKASCKALFALAERLGVSPGKVGRVCNEMGVHIRACQLGCFK